VVVVVTEAGLTLSRQAPAATAATVTVDEDATAPRLVRELVDVDAVQEAVVASIRTAFDGLGVPEVYELVEEHDLEASADVAADSHLLGIGRGEWSAVRDLIALFRGVGEGWSPTEDAYLLGRLLALDDETAPTIAVRVKATFQDQEARRRRPVCRLLSELSEGADVRVVATPVTQRYLAHVHADELPTGVQEQVRTPRSSGAVEDAVDAALSDLDPDGPVVTTLRAVADAPTDTRTFHSLQAELPRAESTVRRHVGALADLDLVERHGPDQAREVSLRRAGRAYLDAVDATVGRQQALGDCVQATPTARNDTVYTRDRPREAGRTGRSAGGSGPRYGTEFLGTWNRMYAATATPPESGVSVVNYPVEHRESREAWWSYDADRDDLLVSVEHRPKGALGWWVTAALAFTDGRMWEDGGPLDEATREEHAELFEEHAGWLRSTRGMGWLPNGTDVHEFVEGLQEYADDLRDLTRKLHHETYETDESEFRAEIIRQAMGLATVVVHFCDLASTDVHLEIALPEYSRRYDVEDRDDLLTTVGKAATKFSTLNGNHVAFKHLYEAREDVRRQADDLQVKADDPYGESVVTWSFVGDFRGKTEQFTEALRRRFAEPDELVDDAPEAAVTVPFAAADPTAEQYTRVANRVLDSKNLVLTAPARKLLQAVARTPYDVATALSHLGSEDEERRIRLSEVRYALAHLPADRLLEGATSTPRKALAALLASDEPLTTTEWADRADVSTQSLREHRDRLVALDLVVEDDGEYRLHVAFHTDAERHDDGRLPWYVDDAHAEPRDVWYEAALELVDDPSRAGDATDQIFGEWVDPPDDGVPDVDRLAEAEGWAWVGKWGLRLVEALVGAGEPHDEPHRVRSERIGEPMTKDTEGMNDGGHEPLPTANTEPCSVATFGAEIEQAPIETASRAGGTA
jgi:hypothetical protein